MRLLTLVLGTVSLLLILGSCRETVPKEHTSLVLSSVRDPGKPKKKLTMVWHHHSTGDRLLQGGLKKALKKNNIEFYDINYNEAKVGDYVIGDHTDPPDFPKNFNTPEYFDKIVSWELNGAKKKHDIVMFKSCFPASNIESDQMFEKYKSYYNSLLPTFEKHRDILFIGMSTPPLVKSQTTYENAKRARKWAKWVTTEYAKDMGNIKMFDLFGALAVREGFPGENMLVPQFAESKTDSHPAGEAGRAVVRLFIPWLNQAIANAGIGR